jgi:hypothetical protein
LKRIPLFKLGGAVDIVAHPAAHRLPPGEEEPFDQRQNGLNN